MNVIYRITVGRLQPAFDRHGVVVFLRVFAGAFIGAFIVAFGAALFIPIVGAIVGLIVGAFFAGLFRAFVVRLVVVRWVFLLRFRVFGVALFLRGFASGVGDADVESLPGRRHQFLGLFIPSYRGAGLEAHDTHGLEDVRR